MSDDAKKPKEKQIDAAVDFVAGTIAGIAGLTIAYPFDTVKVRFQSPETAGRYRSTFHAFKTIVREERFKGLYKGIASPMLSCAPLNGLVFASHRFFMRLQIQSDDSEPTITQIGLAGAGSGIVASLITCPIELIKIRQQNMIESRPTALSVALGICRTHGLKGLYRGLAPTALRDIGYGAYFATYEATCRFFGPSRHPVTPRGGENLGADFLGTDRTILHTDHTSLLSEVESEMATHSWGVLLLAGALAGINGWLTTFMFDVVKTRVQSVDYAVSGQGVGATTSTPALAGARSTVAHPYRTTLSTIINSYRIEGISFFFRGLTPTLLRAIPVNMATFGVFEAVVYLLS